MHINWKIFFAEFTLICVLSFMCICVLFFMSQQINVLCIELPLICVRFFTKIKSLLASKNILLMNYPCCVCVCVKIGLNWKLTWFDVLAGIWASLYICYPWLNWSRLRFIASTSQKQHHSLVFDRNLSIRHL